jgi:hypothetical protein
VFTKLDLRSGYHQLSLAEESRHITIFATHKGLHRYKKLNFGTNSASEIFQHVISEQIRDIPNAINISDDIIIFGQTQADHDEALRAVFERFSQIGLTLNQDKCEFSQSQLTFFGFVTLSSLVKVSHPTQQKLKQFTSAQLQNQSKKYAVFLAWQPTVLSLSPILVT